VDNNISSTYRLSFRVSHPLLKADRISTELGLNPRYTWNVGERARNKKNEEIGPIRKDTYCSYDVDYGPDVSGIADEISRFLKDMEYHKDFLRQIAKTGGKLSFYLAWFISNRMSGEIFTSALIERMADLRIDFAIEIYPDMQGTEQA
jgi:Domain of unknown function (DUF4279)